MSARARREALAASAVTVALAALIMIVVRAQTAPEMRPPEDVAARSIVVLLVAPATIGAVGALRQVPSVVIAAGTLCLLQSFVGFGSTLPFLLPALLFLHAGVGGADSSRTRAPWRIGRTTVAVAVALPLSLAVVLTFGVRGILVLVLVAVALAVRPRRMTGPRRWAVRSWLAAGAALALVLAAWVGWFASTEERCWVARETPAGIAYEPVGVGIEPPTLDDTTIAAGCDSGVPTLGGAALALGLVVAASAAAAAPAPPARAGAMGVHE